MPTPSIAQVRTVKLSHVPARAYLHLMVAPHAAVAHKTKQLPQDAQVTEHLTEPVHSTYHSALIHHIQTISLAVLMLPIVPYPGAAQVIAAGLLWYTPPLVPLRTLIVIGIAPPTVQVVPLLRLQQDLVLLHIVTVQRLWLLSNGTLFQAQLIMM